MLLLLLLLLLVVVSLKGLKQEDLKVYYMVKDRYGLSNTSGVYVYCGDGGLLGAIDPHYFKYSDPSC